MSDVPLNYSFLHRFWSKKFASHFCRETTNKNIHFSKWETWIFNAILDQTKFWRALWIRIYFNSYLFLVWVSTMQSNVECRLHEEDVILKEPPLRGGKLRGRVGPPRTPLFKCGSSPNSRLISHLRIDYFGLMIDKKTKTTDSAFWLKLQYFTICCKNILNDVIMKLLLRETYLFIFVQMVNK